LVVAWFRSFDLLSFKSSAGIVPAPSKTHRLILEA